MKSKRLTILLLAALVIVILLGAGFYYFAYLAPRPPTAAETLAFNVARLQYHANTLRGHSNELKNAVGRASDPAVRRHSEHIINVLVGKSSPDYGDLDRDGIVEDPGDGTGMLNYVQMIRDYAAANNAAAAVQALDRTRAVLLEILTDTRTILAANDFNDIHPQIDNAQRLSNQVARGAQDSVPQIAQLLNATTTQTRVNPDQPASDATVVDMQQFVFNPKQLTVKKGTTVIFVNKDNAKHTVTEDTRAWNSLDIPAGKTFSFTFKEPGTVAFHCEYHGDVDGIDMAGTITVTGE